MTPAATISLYISIFIATTFLAYRTQGISKNGAAIFRKNNLYLSFFIHWVFFVFTDIGVDYYHYVRIINRLDNWNSIIEYSELGFALPCYFLSLIFRSPHVVIFFIKTITLALFYFGFWKIKDKVRLGLPVLTYNMFLFLQGFYILGMQISIAFLFLSLIYLLENKNTKAIIYLLLAVSTHSSSILFIPIYVFFFWINKKNKTMNGFKIFVLALSYISVYGLIRYVIPYLISVIPQFRQYNIYDFVTGSNGTGLAQYVFFIPILYFVWMIYVNCTDSRYKNLVIIMSMSAFLFAMTGYRIEVFARMNKSFYGLYALLIPMMFYMRKSNDGQLKEKTRFKLNYHLDMTIWVFYILIRGVDFFYNHLGPTSSSNLRNYHFFWPFTV